MSGLSRSIQAEGNRTNRRNAKKVSLFYLIGIFNHDI